MKIVYDYQIFTGQEYGGVSRYYYEIVSRLSKHPNITAQVWAPFYQNAYAKDDPTFPIWGIPVPALAKLGKITRFLSSNGCTIRSKLPLLHPIDIWHETYFWEGQSCPPSGAKKILTVYDMIHEKFPQFFSQNDLTPKKKAIAAKNADHIICISHSTKKDLIEFCDIPENKISVTHLGFFLKNPCEYFDFREKTQEKPYILYTGQRGGYKNFIHLLDAFASSDLLKKDFHLLCFGGGSFSSDEKEKIKSLSLSENVISQIGGDDSLLSYLYKNAALFVYPSLYEGFGIPPLEAMALGCPVLTSHEGSLKEVVGSAAEICSPYETASIKEGMERVLYSPSYSLKLKQLGLEQVKLFSWDKCAKETIEIYKNCHNSHI